MIRGCQSFSKHQQRFHNADLQSRPIADIKKNLELFPACSNARTEVALLDIGVSAARPGRISGGEAKAGVSCVGVKEDSVRINRCT